jgi:hypothetical protein
MAPDIPPAMAVTLHKDRIEFVMPARLMYGIATADVFVFTDKDKGRADLERMRDLLREASIAPLRGLPPRIMKIVAAQIDRVHRAIMHEYHLQRADKLATSIYYFLKNLIDSEYLELWEDSPVAQAAAIYLPMIEHVFDETKLDASAQKQADKILRRFHDRGYYT